MKEEKKRPLKMPTVWISKNTVSASKGGASMQQYKLFLLQETSNYKRQK